MERIDCPVCARSCAAQARRCLGCGALLARPAGGVAAPAPAEVPAPSSTGSSGSLLKTLLAVALMAAAVRIGWGELQARQAEAEQRAERAAAAAVARRTAPPEAKVSPAPPVAEATMAVPPPAAPAVRREAPPRPLPALPAYPWSDGARGFRSAANEQLLSGCPMLLYFHTDWCPYCKQFDRAVLPDARVAAAIAPAVKVSIDPERDDDAQALARRFGVRGYPTLLLVAADGAPPIHLSSGVSREEGPHPERFAESMRERLARAWDSQAAAQVRAGKLDDAIRKADQLLAFDPSYSSGRAYYLRALAFHKKGELSEALRDYRAGCAAGCADCCATAR